MSEENNREYFEDRAANARQMAANAVDPAIGKIHAEMADRYDELAEHAGSGQRATLHMKIE
jgi:hypothetical protein